MPETRGGGWKLDEDASRRHGQRDLAHAGHYTAKTGRACPLHCGEWRPEGSHFEHQPGACGWHDGPCESPAWCPCGKS